MTQIEREELLRRYIDGQMSLEQEHEFFIEVALDKELRHGLKAQREIDEAMQADRGQPTPSEYASLQSSLATVLAATPGAIPVHATSGTASSSASASALSTGWTVSGLAVAISVAGASVVAMVVMYIGSLSNTNTMAPASTTPRVDPVEIVTDQRSYNTTVPLVDSTLLLQNTSVGTTGSTASSLFVERGDKPSGAIRSKEKEKPSQKIEFRSVDGRKPAGNTPLDTLSLKNGEMFPDPELDSVDPNLLLQKEGSADPETAEESEIDIKARVQWKDKNGAEQPK